MSWTRLQSVAKREIQRFLRIPIQTLISPWISALLYILVFGVIIGSRITFFEDISYIDFVLPGIVMMNLIAAAFGQSSSSLYFHRWTKTIHEMLTAPLSYAEMIIGYMTGALIRSFIVGAGVYVLALFFTQATMAHLGIFIFYIVVVSLLFSLIGLIVGLWAERFEHLNVLQTFVITPLIYVGGVFNSIDMLPESLHWLVRLNPFFYMVDGLRYSMISYTEGHLLGGSIALAAAVVILFILVAHLFRRGWKLRP